MAKHTGTNDDFLAMALIGYEAQKVKINDASRRFRPDWGIAAQPVQEQ